MSRKFDSTIVVIVIDIGKNSFHVVGHDERCAIVRRQKSSRGQMEARFTNQPPCLDGMEVCVGAHHLSRKLNSLGRAAGLAPAKYVRPYTNGQKNDFRDAEAIALANKLARIAWSVLARGRAFEAHGSGDPARFRCPLQHAETIKFCFNGTYIESVNSAFGP